MRRAVIFAFLLLFLASGCQSPLLSTSAPTASPGATHRWTQTGEPTALPSAAPSRAGATRLAPSPTPMPTSTPTPEPTPLPVQSSDLNLLLLGTDRRVGADPIWRTDTIIVVAVRPQAGIIAMLSIPRDLWVTIPGYGQDRINVADCYGETKRGRGGGPALVAATLKQNLGITVDATVRIHFEGLARIIDTLGGINITSDRAFDEWFWDETAPNGVSHMRVITGTQRMDGRLALQYVRARHGSSDFDRSRRQQQVLLAIRDAALRPETLPRLPRLLVALSDTVETDIRFDQALSLVGLALRLKPTAFRQRVFDSSMVRDWTTPEGAQVLLPNRARIQAVWAELTAP